MSSNTLAIREPILNPLQLEEKTINGEIKGIYINAKEGKEYVTAIRVGVEEPNDYYFTNPIILPKSLERSFCDIGSKVILTAKMNRATLGIIYEVLDLRIILRRQE